MDHLEKVAMEGHSKKLRFFGSKAELPV